MHGERRCMESNGLNCKAKKSAIQQGHGRPCSHTLARQQTVWPFVLRESTPAWSPVDALQETSQQHRPKKAIMAIPTRFDSDLGDDSRASSVRTSPSCTRRKSSSMALHKNEIAGCGHVGAVMQGASDAAEQTHTHAHTHTHTRGNLLCDKIRMKGAYLDSDTRSGCSAAWAHELKLQSLATNQGTTGPITHRSGSTSGFDWLLAGPTLLAGLSRTPCRPPEKTGTVR